MAEQSGVQSLERAFALLELLSLHPAGMQLMELANASGLHKSTTHRLLTSLAALGYVKSRDGRYKLTMKLFEMAGRALGGIDVLDVARPILDRLRERVEEAVHLVVRDGSDIVYVHKADNPSGSYQMVSRIGLRRPLYCTAAGKSILSTLGDREIAGIWERSDVIAHTAHTITELPRLYRELDAIAKQGYALDNEENELGVRCIGAAIRDYTGHCQGAFSISMPTTRASDERIDQLSPIVVETAAEISAELGYRKSR